MILDVLVFAAHPDDAELSMGGTIAKLTKDKFKVGIVDLTKAELSTRGNVSIRKKEAANADKVLETAVRVNLGIPDGEIKRTKENLLKVVGQIREYKPKIIFAPHSSDRHPDHQDASALIKHAMFSAGLIKIKTFKNKKEQVPYRPKKLFYYMQTYVFDPTFIVDITETIEQKMEAVKAYYSQFYDPKSRKPETFISKPQFINYVVSRAQFYGFQIGKHYGEPFYCEEKIEYDFKLFL